MSNKPNKVQAARQRLQDCIARHDVQGAAAARAALAYETARAKAQSAAAMAAYRAFAAKNN